MEEMFSRGWDALIARERGPLPIRLILQPLGATILALRAGWRDPRERQPAGNGRATSGGGPFLGRSGSMTRTWMRYVALALAFALVVGAVVFLNRNQPALGAEQADKGAGGPHYTVLETEGHNLVVTDNATDTLYFYTVDKG